MLSLFRKYLFTFLLLMITNDIFSQSVSMEDIKEKLNGANDIIVTLVFILLFLLVAFLITAVHFNRKAKASLAFAKKEKSLFISKTKHDQAKAEELLLTKILAEAEASELKASSAIKNHNLRNHYMNIQAALLGGRYLEVMNYVEKSATYFKDFYESLLKDKISLEEEYLMFEKFYLAESILLKKNITIRKNFYGLESRYTAFLSDTFASLYQNSLNSAFISDTEEYFFSLTVIKDGDIIDCIISDNGSGYNQIKIVKDHYLDILSRRVVNAFKRKGKIVSTEQVFSIESDSEKGTTIKFKLPYENL